MLDRLFHRASDPAEAPTRLGEDDVLVLARREVGERVPLRIARRVSGPGGVEWEVVTSTIDDGSTLRIDDATGRVTDRRRWRRRGLFRLRG